MGAMTATRLFFGLVILCLCFACGDDKGTTGGLDLIGDKKQRGGPMAGPGGSAPTVGAASGATYTVDLIEDLVFRYQRDRWTLTTPGAHVNVEKLKAGGVNLVLSALPLEAGANPERALDKGLEITRRLVTDTNGEVVLAASFDEARSIHQRGKVAMMLLMEGGDLFLKNPERLVDLKKQGLAAVGLLAGRSNAFADAAVAPRDPGGLTEKGKTFLQLCRDAGIAVDLTHLSQNAFWDALAEQSGQAMVSHTAARALMDHPRNLDDVQILALSRYGGILGLIFNPDFLRPGAEASLDDVVAHIAHIKSIGAIGALALGTDYGGINPPSGLDNVSHLPSLRRALSGQGLTDKEIAGLFGDNAAGFLEDLSRDFGAVQHTADQILRPVAMDCESVVGESEGLPTLACNHYLRDTAAVIPPGSRHKVRIKNMTLQPVSLELFGEPGLRWQVEGQNLAGKILFHRFVQLDGDGVGSISLPADRNLTRMFLSPTRASALREAVVWGRKPVKDSR